jgi:hypothetical protein
MRFIHAIIFILSASIFALPILARPVTNLLFENVTHDILFTFTAWDTLFLASALLLMSLVVSIEEQLREHRPTLKALHYVIMLLAIWVGASPFLVFESFDALFLSQLLSGIAMTGCSFLHLTIEEYA